MKNSTVRIQLVIGGIFLLKFWLTAISAIRAGTIFAYQNYWGAPQEKYTLVFMLLLATPIYFILVWRHFVPRKKKLTKKTEPKSRLLTPISERLYKARSVREASKEKLVRSADAVRSEGSNLS